MPLGSGARPTISRWSQDFKATDRANLAKIATRVRDKYPHATIVIAGMRMPANLGPEYTRAFENVFPDVARETDAVLIPFLLDGVGGVPSLNQADGIHPNVAGHRLVAEIVWHTLRPLL